MSVGFELRISRFRQPAALPLGHRALQDGDMSKKYVYFKRVTLITSFTFDDLYMSNWLITISFNHK